MKRLIIFLLAIFIYFSEISYCQQSPTDSSTRFKLHLGLNFGFLGAGGNVGGGGIKLAPRIGVHLNNKFVLGLESNSDYQTVYSKDSLMDPSIRVSKWIGPFVRYYVFKPTNKWNMCLSGNYIFGSYYELSNNQAFRTNYNTAFLGFGASYRKNHFSLDGGYRYTFLLNNTPIEARWANTLYLGCTWNF